MATASNLRLEWKNPVEAGREISVTLSELPIAAALLDGTGTIRASNEEWSRNAAKGIFAPAVQAGIREVIQGRTPRFAHDFEENGVWYRLMVTPRREGALATQQTLEPQATAQSEKMQTAGRLLGGVSHDFANLLTLISGYSEMLLGRIGERDPIRAELDEIRKAANRGARLIGQLLGFTRGRTMQPVVLDLNDIVNGIARMLRPIIGETIDLQLDLSPDPGKVLADPGQMEQVLMNLLLNARDAMPTGGRITIETCNSLLDEETAEARGIAAGPCVLLAITDTGHGMEPGVLARLWEPFFTTKPAGKGTGLGLNTVRKIIKEQQGDVWVRSAPGEGSTFTICLPAASGDARETESQPKLHPVRSGEETVMVVEDEESVRRLLMQVLQRRGYRVLEAADGTEALRLFRESKSGVHLILTDMVMPRMGGRELAEQVQRIRPGAKILFMSGYTDDMLIRTGVLGPGVNFLQKPLRAEVLATKVREMLDAPARPLNLN